MVLASVWAAMDEAEAIFRDHVGAAPSVAKPGGDFATEADLAIERLLRERLGKSHPVFGEEAGGNIHEDLVWVVDPIDGTSNYSTGNPNCGIIVCLLDHGQPAAAVISLPNFGIRVSAERGGPLQVTGRDHAAGLDEPRPYVSQVGFGSIVSPPDSRFPTRLRHQLLGELAAEYPRLRITGSVGVDLAFTALGVFGGAVSFSPHVWDNAAGVLLVQAAGGVATDLRGEPWQPLSQGVLAGTSEVHQTLLAAVKATRTQSHPAPPANS